MLSWIVPTGEFGSLNFAFDIIVMIVLGTCVFCFTLLPREKQLFYTCERTDGLVLIVLEYVCIPQ